MHKLRFALPLMLLAASLSAQSLASETVDDGFPPKNLTSTNTTPAEVLRGYRRAVGHATGNTLHTSITDYTATFAGLSGTIHEVSRAQESRTDSILGGMNTADGTLAGKKWSMNENGQVTVESGLHQRDDIDAAALHAAPLQSSGVKLIGESSTPAAFVVEVNPPGGRIEYIFFDKRTLLVDRIERMREGRRVVFTFDDYRNTQGVTEPWHIHVDDGRPNNVREEHVTALRYGAAVADADLAMPPPPKPIASATSFPASVGGTIVEDRIIITAGISGHKVNFQLDSGASGIVVDRDIVDALNLEQHGRITGETAGTYVESDVVIPKMQIGDVVVEGAHARSLPFTMWTGDGKPVAGLLGFDFIHDVVLHIDYLHGTVEALSPATFTPPAGARSLPIALDDQVPLISVAIGNARNLHFLLDTGADRSMLFAQFVSAHPSDASDQGLGTAMQASSPFVNDFLGVGGTVDYRPMQIGPLDLAGWTFPHWLFYVTQNAPSFESEDYDGLIGQDVLRNYDVWLDYPHLRVYLRPNDRFRQRWG
jgi:predicted aspartyl protease